MARFMGLSAPLALCLALWWAAAGAQEQSANTLTIQDFAVDIIELYDDDENFIDDKSTSEINLKTVKVIDQKVGMLHVTLDGEEYWIYDSDVILAGEQDVDAKECLTVAQAAESRVAATMGLGCSE